MTLYLKMHGPPTIVVFDIQNRSSLPTSHARLAAKMLMFVAKFLSPLVAVKELHPANQLSVKRHSKQPDFSTTIGCYPALTSPFMALVLHGYYLQPHRSAEEPSHWIAASLLAFHPIFCMPNLGYRTNLKELKT